jgi:hypothetical protein
MEKFRVKSKSLDCLPFKNNSAALRPARLVAVRRIDERQLQEDRENLVEQYSCKFPDERWPRFSDGAVHGPRPLG